MSDALSPETFADTGSNATVNAARLNNHVNGLTILPAFISGKSAVSPATGDYLVFLDVSSGNLAKATLSTILGLVSLPPADPVAGTAGSRTLGTGAQQAAPGNDTRFGASVTGVRKSAGAGSTDVAAKPPDYALAATVGTLASGAVTLDCSLNNNFTVTLDDNATITLSNIGDGDTVTVQTTQDSTGGWTLAFTTTQTKTWPNSTPIAVSAAVGAVDLWIFTRRGSSLRVSQLPAFG